MSLVQKLPALVMIVSVMLGAGLQIDRPRLVETLRNYSLMARALLVNFVLVPGFALLVVTVFKIETDVATGILLMSMAPGVPFLVNAAGRKTGGSLSFALVIAYVFSALSVVTIPLTAELILPHDASASVPVSRFLTTLIVFQLVPLLVGALIAPRLADAAIERSAKVLQLVFFVAVAVFLVGAFPKLVASVGAVYGSAHLIAVILIGLFAAGAGWLLGGPDRDYRHTLSIGSLLRNIGLCALIGSDEFAGTLVVPAIISYLAVTFAMSIPLRMFYKKTAAPAAAA